MRRFFVTALALSIFLIAGSASAKDLIWDFRSNQGPPTEATKLTNVTPMGQGIHIQTSTDGFLKWEPKFTQTMDVLHVFVYNSRDSEASLLWHKKGDAQDQVWQSYFEIPGGTNELQDVTVSLADVPRWSSDDDIVALAFPAGSDLILQRLEWQHVALTEKVGYAWNSFWHTDKFRLYSINFLWGPLLVFDQSGIDSLYSTLPPNGWSALRVFYAVIAASIVIAGIVWVIQKKKRTALAVIACTVAAAWIVLDVRMVDELVTYAVRDITSYVLPSTADKIFRTHAGLFTMLEELQPAFADHPTFTIFMPPEGGVYSQTRYFAYPSIPIPSTQSGATMKAVFAFERPDIKVSLDKRLIDANGFPLSGSGHIRADLGDDSFFFESP